MTEALETLERARGHPPSFHQLVGETDLKLDEVLALRHDAGRLELAGAIETDPDLLDPSVLHGRSALTGGRRHVFEARRRPAAAQATRRIPNEGARSA